MADSQVEIKRLNKAVHTTWASPHLLDRGAPPISENPINGGGGEWPMRGRRGWGGGAAT
jgi:hypothetical protein